MKIGIFCFYMFYSVGFVVVFSAGVVTPSSVATGFGLGTYTRFLIGIKISVTHFEGLRSFAFMDVFYR